MQLLCEVLEGSDANAWWGSGGFHFFGQKHLNAVYDALIYLWVYFAGGGGQGVAKKKSMHQWFDQAFCKPEKFEGVKRQGEDNNLNTRRLADD